MYQQQLSNQLQQAQQGFGGLTPEQIAQQQQQIAYLQQQHQIMLQQLQQQQMQFQAQAAQGQGINLQPGIQQQQQQQNPFPALYQPQFLGVNPQQVPAQQQQQQPLQGQLPPNYQPFPIVQPGAAALIPPNLAQGQQPQNDILPNQNNIEVVNRILSNLGVNMKHESSNVKFSDSKQLNSFMVQRQLTKNSVKEQTANDENTCPICICDFESKDKIITLKKCGHYFHEECIRDWLTKANLTCPLCRDELEVPKEWLGKN